MTPSLDGSAGRRAYFGRTYASSGAVTESITPASTDGSTPRGRFEVRDSGPSEWKDAWSSEEMAVVALIRDRTYASSGASVLVRIQPDAAGSWLDSLPAVPHGAIVSVSATSTLIPEHAEALIARGYVVVGVLPTGDGCTAVDLVDLVVPNDLIEDDPDWWRHVRAIAWRALPVMHGPVARVHARLLGRHAVARRDHAITVAN